MLLETIDKCTFGIALFDIFDWVFVVIPYGFGLGGVKKQKKKKIQEISCSCFFNRPNLISFPFFLMEILELNLDR